MSWPRRPHGVYAGAQGSGALVEELAVLREELEATALASYAARVRGAIDALEWLTREGASAAPASRRVAEADISGAASEMYWAEEVEVGTRRRPEGVAREYFGGVSAALTWALGQTDMPPA